MRDTMFDMSTDVATTRCIASTQTTSSSPRGSAKQNTYSVLIAPCNLLLLLRCSSAPPAAARAATLLSPLQIIGIFNSTEMPDLSFCVNPLRS